MEDMFAAWQAQRNQAPAQFAAPQPQGYQQMPANFTPPAQAPKTPAVAGSLSALFGQPNAGNGPAVKLTTQTPVGTTVLLKVARDVVDGDVRQQTSPQTKQPLFRNDDSPMFVLVVPVVNLSNNSADESLWCGGQMWTAMNGAMHKAGYPAGTAPKEGDLIKVTIESRFTNGFGNASNKFKVEYGIAEKNRVAAPSATEGIVEQAVAEFTGEPPFAPDATPAAAAPLSPQAQQITENVATIQAAAPAGPQLTPEMQAILEKMTG